MDGSRAREINGVTRVLLGCIGKITGLADWRSGGGAAVCGSLRQFCGMFATQRDGQPLPLSVEVCVAREVDGTVHASVQRAQGWWVWRRRTIERLQSLLQISTARRQS